MLSKVLIISLLLFSFNKMNAQTNTDDTVLDEVIIHSKTKKKIKKVKVKGFPFYSYFSKNESVITGFEKLPEGKITTVTFNFNNKFTRFTGDVFNQINTNYLDMQFGLLVFERNADGTVGAVISNCVIKFLVSKEHKGNFVLNVSEIDFPESGFFIGFKVLSETYEKEASFYVMMCDNDENTSYRTYNHFNISDRDQLYNSNGEHLKITLGIEQ